MNDSYSLGGGGQWVDQDLPNKIIKVIFVSALFSNAILKAVLCQKALFCQGWSFVRKGSPLSDWVVSCPGSWFFLCLCPGRWSLLGKMAFVKEGGLCQSWSLSGKVVRVREDGHLSRVVSHQGLWSFLILLSVDGHPFLGIHLHCCFTSTETIGTIKEGSLVHLLFHTAPELWRYL